MHLDQNYYFAFLEDFECLMQVAQVMQVMQATMWAQGD
jgi:hypothetical protein